MTILAAISVTLRVMIMLLAAAMVVGWWSKIAAVIMMRPGWKGHLSGFIATVMAVGVAIGSSTNIFPDADIPIPDTIRLAGVDLGLALIVLGILTSIYRRSLRSGPVVARRVFFSGLALIVPALGFVVLLTLGGANA